MTEESDWIWILILKDKQYNRALNTGKAIKVKVLTSEGSFWLPLSIIRSEFNAYDYEEWQEVLIDSWWLRKNGLVSY